MRLGLDLDGPIYEFIPNLRAFIHSQYGRPLDDMGDQVSWHFSNEWGYTSEDVDRLVQEAIDAKELWWTGDPVEGAVEALSRLRQKHEIVIVTNRFWGGVNYTEATRSWLDDYGVPYDELIVTGRKTDLDIDLLLDDGPANIEDRLLTDEQTVIWDAPYNRAFPGDRVKSWTEFEILIFKYVHGFKAPWLN